jgi:hypothetical protein
MNVINIRGVSVTLEEKSWLYRAFEVVTTGGVYRVTYNGRGLGYESVTVNEEVAARQVSVMWFVPEFCFSIGSTQAIVKVKVWPWLAIRSFELIIDGESVYSE